MAPPLEFLKRIQSLVSEEKAEEAIRELTRYLEQRDHPHCWIRLAYCYQIVGEPMAARAIFRNLLLKFPDPHIVDIIAGRLTACKPLVVDEFKLLYFPIPKCGSSSVKDALLIATGQEPRGETSHFHTGHMSTVLDFRDVDDQFSDYFRFTVIRPARDRIRSYWRMNIQDGSLKQEATGKERFYGLSTSPDYLTFLKHFRRYRDVFRDARHHTDALEGFLGRNPSRFSRIYTMKELPEALSKVSEASGKEIPLIRNMASKRPKADISREVKSLEDDILANFYSDEARLYPATPD